MRECKEVEGCERAEKHGDAQRDIPRTQEGCRCCAEQRTERVSNRHRAKAIRSLKERMSESFGCGDGRCGQEDRGYGDETGAKVFH